MTAINPQSHPNPVNHPWRDKGKRILQRAKNKAELIECPPIDRVSAEELHGIIYALPSYKFESYFQRTSNE